VLQPKQQRHHDEGRNKSGRPRETWLVSDARICEEGHEDEGKEIYD